MMVLLPYGENGDTREDLHLPESELGHKIREEFEKGGASICKFNIGRK